MEAKLREKVTEEEANATSSECGFWQEDKNAKECNGCQREFNISRRKVSALSSWETVISILTCARRLYG